MKNNVLLFLCIVIAIIAPNPAPGLKAAPVEHAPEIAALTAGVKEIAAPGLPGAVVAIADNAFPVVAGKVGKEARESVVAAAVAGPTRIVAFGHDGYFKAENLVAADTAKLLDNALTWTAGGIKPVPVGVIGDTEVLQTLTASGYKAVKAQRDQLAEYSTLVVNGHSLTDADLAPLQKYLKNGGGLVIATTGWGWSWDDNTKSLAHDFVGNKLLAPYGLIWTMGTVSSTAPAGFKVEPVTPLANAQNALVLLQSANDLTPLQSEQVAAVLGDAMTGLPESDTQLLPALKKLAEGATGDVVPFERAPVTMKQPRARLLLTLQTNLDKKLPSADVKPHPAGAIFPGDVPPNVKPVTKTVMVDTKITEWHSTGLYAAPGAPVTIALPAGVLPQGLSVRIGAHTDTLYHLDSWKRAPDISRSWSLESGTTKVANPFGGLVYIVVPDDAKARQVDVTIGGAYAAPLWVQGETSLADWKKTIRWAPAPWAEIVTDKIILTVPARSVRDLDDPQPLADFYNKGMDAAFALFGAPPRTRPERIVADVQISAGYMHSGYPIMTWLDVEKTTVDLAAIKKFPWGHFHEIGHNFQQSAWTFDGTGETTNNLLPLYVWTKLLKHDIGSAHPALTDAERAQRWKKYNDGGRKFNEWKSSPWLALEMYLQLQEAFGWKPFQKAFAEYETLTEAVKLSTEEEQHDLWMERMSRATGRNLGPFFEKWNVPVSAAARASVASLPAWMPKFPGEK